MPIFPTPPLLQREYIFLSANTGWEGFKQHCLTLPTLYSSLQWQRPRKMPAVSGATKVPPSPLPPHSPGNRAITLCFPPPNWNHFLYVKRALNTFWWLNTRVLPIKKKKKSPLKPPSPPAAWPFSPPLPSFTSWKICCCHSVICPSHGAPTHFNLA